MRVCKNADSQNHSRALDTELDSELGYSKYDYKNKRTTNSRNVHSDKTVQGSMGEMELQVPRDCYGTVCIIKKVCPLCNIIREEKIFY